MDLWALPNLLEGANVSPQCWERRVRGRRVEEDHQIWCHQQVSAVSVATGSEGSHWQ